MADKAKKIHPSYQQVVFSHPRRAMNVWRRYPCNKTWKLLENYEFAASVLDSTPIYVLAEHRAGHSTVQAGSAALRPSGNIIICTFKLRLDVWFFPSDFACISRPSLACCLLHTVHALHACTHTHTHCEAV